MFLWKRLSDIERRKCHEDVRLEKCHEKLEKPKWKCENTEGSSMERWDLFTDVDDHTDEDRTDEDIEEETHRERSYTDELSDEVKPTDKYTDDLLCCRISVIVPEIVRKMMDRTFEIYRSELSNENNRERKYERRREIRVDRTEICTEPLILRNECEPVEHETDEITEKDYDDQSSEKPEVVLGDFLITDEITSIHVDTVHDIESKSPETRKLLSADRSIHEGDEEKKHSHKYPSREDRIGDRKTSDRPTMDDISFWCWDMWSLMSTCFMRIGLSMDRGGHRLGRNSIDDICRSLFRRCVSRSSDRSTIDETKCESDEEACEDEAEEFSHRQNFGRSIGKCDFFANLFSS